MEWAKKRSIRSIWGALNIPTYLRYWRTHFGRLCIPNNIPRKRRGSKAGSKKAEQLLQGAIFRIQEHGQDIL